MIRQIDEGAHIDPSLLCGPSITAQSLRQGRDNAGMPAELTELQHHSTPAQLAAEPADHFTFTAALNDNVEIIRANDATREELEQARHHARVLRRAQRQRHDADQSSAFARGND